MPHEKPVKPYITRLDPNNAYWMARLARVVYVHKDDEAKTPDRAAILSDLQNEDPDFERVVVASKSSAQGILVKHKNYFCLSFRGTDEPADWVDNLNAVATEELFGKFHRGFWNSVQDVWEILFGQYQLLSREQEKSAPLFLTGHSLGGAMATVAAAILSHRDIPFTSCYTFGQPRAMSKDTARLFNMECKGRFFRFHNNNDIVTRVPARIMGYSHVGEYLYISEEKVIHKEPGFWFRFVDYVDGAVAALKVKGFDGVEDHDMERYLEAVSNWNVED